MVVRVKGRVGGREGGREEGDVRTESVESQASDTHNHHQTARQVLVVHAHLNVLQVGMEGGKKGKA